MPPGTATRADSVARAPCDSAWRTLAPEHPEPDPPRPTGYGSSSGSIGRARAATARKPTKIRAKSGALRRTGPRVGRGLGQTLVEQRASSPKGYVGQGFCGPKNTRRGAPTSMADGTPNTTPALGRPR